MKNLCTLIYILSLFSSHSIFAEDRGVSHIGRGSVIINGDSYGLKVECEKPFNAHISLAQCTAKRPTVDVAILSSVSLAESKTQGNKILACIKTGMWALYPYDFDESRMCKGSRFVNFKVFDKNGTMFYEKKTPIIHLPLNK